MVRCCVGGCKREGSKGYHAFPAKEEVAMRWIDATKSEHLIPRLFERTLSHSHYKVCSIHFEEDSFMTNGLGQRCLKKNTIPTLFLPDVPHRPRKYSQRLKKPVNKDTTASNQYMNEVNFSQDNTNIFYFPPDANGNTIQIEIGTDVEMRNGNEFVGVQIDEDVKMKDISECTTASSIENKGVTSQNKIAAEVAVLAEKLNKKNMKKIKRLKKQLKEQKMNNDNVLKYLGGILKKQQFQFFEMQLLNCRKTNRGQRYTDEQKSLCLALYKQSPKCYRFMQRIFTLPSKSTIGRHSAQLLCEAGIDKKFFEFLKEKVKDLPEIDKYCTIAWDEVSLTKHLDYSPARDEIDGFVELVDVRRPDFATHSLNFMIRGINTPYKQNVAHFYTNGLKSFELAETVRIVLESVFDTGLIAIGSTCDQTGTNVSAVHILIDPTNPSKTPDGSLLSFEIRDHRIIHCYDPPHLIKVLRNNLITKDLRHFLTTRWNSVDQDDTLSENAQFARWDHISKLYDIDCQSTHRNLKKITPEHINPNKKKMRVSVATQIFSETFGELMLDCSEQNEIPQNFSETARIILFFNDVFDSMNGSGHPQVDKLAGSINKDSIHFDFWQYALNMLSNMDFIDKETRKVNNYSTVLKKFESTIRGFIELAKICFDLKMTAVSIRNMNQDGLENFFGCVKSCCHNPRALIPTLYRTGVATVMVNNVTNTNSENSNCEKDSCVPLLNNVHELFLSYKSQEAAQERIQETAGSTSDNMIEAIVFDPLYTEAELSFLENQENKTTSSTICQKLLQTTNCKKCKKVLLTHPPALMKNDTITKTKRSDRQTLTFPSEIFQKNCQNLLCRINEIMPNVCYEKSVKHKILTHSRSIHLERIGCKGHNDNVLQKFREYTTKYALMSYCQKINDILSRKIAINPGSSDSIEELASFYSQKGKHIGKHSDKFIDE